MPKGVYEHKNFGNKSRTGLKFSEESKEKMRLKAIGRPSWNKGKKETRREVLEKLRISHSKEKCYNWQGGKSFEPYSLDWTKTLRRSIRERDHYICKSCGKIQEDVTHSVHHIDYDKLNNNPNNLITLCVSCHMKSNFNREKWKNYLKNLIN